MAEETEAARRAYAAAVELIEETGEAAEKLSFDTEDFRALARIPETIARLKRLIVLTLENTAVRDLAPLAGLTALQDLWLNNTAVRDLGPLAGLTALQFLRLDDTAAHDLAPLAGLTALQDLWLNNTAVHDLAPLTGLTALQSLWLDDTAVSDLAPLTGLTALQTLWLDNNAVRDLAPLAGLTALQFLRLDDTAVRDLAPLAEMQELAFLDLRDTKALRDLRPLRNLPSLRDAPDKRNFFGVRFAGSGACADPEMDRISRIEDDDERTRALFALLDSGWVPPVGPPRPADADAEIEAALTGPILSDALADLTDRGGRLEATALAGRPSRQPDEEHERLRQTLAYVAARLGRTEAQNRLGQEIVQSFADYANFIQQEEINARLLIYLADGLRAVVSDDDLAHGLDGFDRTSVTGFLEQHDTLIRDYYTGARPDPKHDNLADPDEIIAYLFPALASAKALIAEAETEGLFAPNVSTALEMIERRAEGARKGYLTGDEAQRGAAIAELRSGSTLTTAYLGRIKGRLQQFAGRIRTEISKEGTRLSDDPFGRSTTWIAVADAAERTAGHLAPIFARLWELIGNLPLPF